MSRQSKLCGICAEKTIAASELLGWVKALTIAGVRCADVIRDGACADCGVFTELVMTFETDEGATTVCYTHGQLGFTVGLGFRAARDRLIKAGALIKNPSRPDHVTITNAGNAFVGALIDRLDRARLRADGSRVGRSGRMKDWTEFDGYLNSSSEFKACVEHVTRLIFNSGHDLIGGRAEVVAGLIVAQLAHVRGLAPSKDLRALVEALYRCDHDVGCKRTATYVQHHRTHRAYRCDAHKQDGDPELPWASVIRRLGV